MVCSGREQVSESTAKVAAEAGNAEQPCRPWNAFPLRLTTLRQHGWCLKENGTIGPRSRSCSCVDPVEGRGRGHRRPGT